MPDVLGQSVVLVLGGARSGKSAVGEHLASRLGGPVLYVATGEAHDPGMAARIAAHRAARPTDWATLEAPRQVGAALDAYEGAVATILVDSVTTLVANALFQDRADPEEDDDRAWPPVAAELQRLLDATKRRGAHVVLVSDEVGMAVVPPYPSGRLFRDILGRANQYLATLAAGVYLTVAGIPVDIKRLATAEGLLGPELS